MRTIHPKGWQRGAGYSHAIMTESNEHLLHFSGVVGSDMGSGQLADGGLVPQFRKALENIREVLAEGAASPADVAVMRIYCTDGPAYMSSLRELGTAFRDIFGSSYPAMTYVEISGLFTPGAVVEIDGVAAVRSSG